MLPCDFTDRMKQMLNGEYEEFLASYDLPKYQSLRINPLKVEKETFIAQNPFSIEQIPWAENGFYYTSEDTPGKHPYHDAGVYYIQEPSAMAPVEYLGAKPGERILDLCAAPGGKSTQIACSMKGEGLFVCNEIHPARAKILSENIERMGVKNALVTNETPQHLSEIFESYFDRILVDAPCSGEGMFRKNEDACGEWSLENVEICGVRQDEILDCAASMLRPGGRLVYSTCTFAPTENEGSIYRFLKRHTDFNVVEVPFYEGMSNGRSEWCEENGEYVEVDETMKASIEKTIRLWPHRLRGEGHYVAVLEKQGSVPEGYEGYCRTGLEKGISEKECKEYFEFAKESLKTEFYGKLLKFGEQLYLMPDKMPGIKGMKVLRPGLHLGTMKKNRFEPSHALALSLSAHDVHHTWNIASDEFEAKAYLNGQTLNVQGDKGWYLITVDNYSIGWGKLAGGIMKNHYPKGLRKNV